MNEVVGYVLANNWFRNLFELNNHLRYYGVIAYKNYSRSHEPYYKFSFSKNGKSVGVGATQRQLRLNKGIGDVEKLFRINQQSLAQGLTAEQRIFIKNLMKTYISMSEPELLSKLLIAGIVRKTTNRYRCIGNDKLFTPPAIGLPLNFMQEVSVNKQVMPIFIRMVKDYLQEMSVHHLSTLIQDENLISGLKAFTLGRQENLSKAQIKVLFSSFIRYNQLRIQDLILKETQKDIAWTNKMINYTNRLNIPLIDKLAFLKRFGIEIGDDVIKVHNTTDKVVHELKPDEQIISLTGDPSEPAKYIKQIESLSDEGYQLLKLFVNDREVNARNKNLEQLLPFIPEDKAVNISETLNLKDEFYMKPFENTNWLTGWFVNEYDMHSDYSKKLRWNHNEDEHDDDDVTIRRRRAQRK